MHWGDAVSNCVASVGSLVLGIDPVPSRVPAILGSDAENFLSQYTSTLLDAAQDKIGIVKFQSAYFESFGSSGIVALARCIAMARERKFLVILDAKRGDIGSTAEAYARAYLSPGGGDLEVDCLTINPFLGPETLEPFVDQARNHGKGLFVLVKTSNPESGWIQDLVVDRTSISQKIAALVARWANETVGDSKVSAVGAVVGATYATEGGGLRLLMPQSVFLAPGLGAQGGDSTALSSMVTPTGPVLVSASRGIASVGDRSLDLTSYVHLMKARINDFKSRLHVVNKPA